MRRDISKGRKIHIYITRNEEEKEPGRIHQRISRAPLARDSKAKTARKTPPKINAFRPTLGILYCPTSSGTNDCESAAMCGSETTSCSNRLCGPLLSINVPISVQLSKRSKSLCTRTVIQNNSKSRRWYWAALPFAHALTRSLPSSRDRGILFSHF